MKKNIFLFPVYCAVLFLFASCDGGKATLHIYNWADYIHPDIIKEFEKEHNCKVVVDNFDSNEAMYAKIKAGAAGYDLIFPSSYMAALLYQQDLLQPIQHSLIPNLQYIDRTILTFTTQDSEMKYSIPYLISTAGIGYNKAKIKDMQPSWAMFNRNDMKGRMTLLNDMRETIGAALKYLGYSLNTVNEKELEEAGEVVIGWKKNIAKFAVEDGKMGLGSGEFFLVHYYNGDILQVMSENQDVSFLLPKEGFSIASDDMVISKGAKQVELAHKFIHFIHEPRICAKNMEYVRFFSPNIEARKLLKPEFLENPAFNPEILKKGESIRDLGKDLVKYTKIWDKIKVAK